MSSRNTNKFEELANCLLPNGVTVQSERPPTGDRARFNYETRVLQAPRPVDEQALWDFLHECAHAILHSDRNIFESVPRHVTEYECERWTRDRFAEEQILSDELIKESSGYLKREIMLNLEVILDRGLDQRAVDYLHPVDRTDLLKSLDDHIRDQTDGLVTGAPAIFPYVGPVTPEKALANPRPRGGHFGIR